ATVEGDLGDAEHLTRALSGHDTVIHVAGLVAARSEAEFLAVNRDGTARLIEAATRAGADRFLLVSSAAAGGPASAAPLDGSEPPTPVTQYGRSKLAAEVVVRGSALRWTIVRPPAVYGPADREMFRVFRAATLGIAPVFGDGTMRLSLVFGPDLGQALVDAARASGTIGGTYYAAHPEIHTSRELIATLGRVVGRKVRVVPVPGLVARVALGVTELASRVAGRATMLTRDKANEFLQAAWTCDPAPLTAASGWRAAHDLERGASLTLDWYRRHRWL
ncbi:MAG: NAD(P)-dependent oxidoreductase, partial [Gemmatimonadales bacterium]